MIAALRQRHRRIIFALGIFLPVAVVAGLVARRPVQVGQSLSAGFAGESVRFDNVIWDRADLWAHHMIRTRLLSEGVNARKFAVELFVTRDLVKPDLLVYWASGVSVSTNKLPDGAALLGAFIQSRPTALALPGGLSRATGSLVLYSLAGQEVVAVSEPVNLTNQ